MAVAGLFALGGYGALAPARHHLPGAARLWMAIPIGAALYLIASLVSIVFAGTLDPLAALLVTGGLGMAGLAVAHRSAESVRSDLKWAGLAVAIAVVTVAVTRLVHMTRLTPDSLRYLLASTDLLRPDALTELNRADLVIRPMGLPALHASFELVGRQYLASIAPLFGVAGLGFFVWLSRRVTEGMDQMKRRRLVLSSVVFLGTSNRLLYDAFYVNAHIQMAVYLLIAVVAAWMAVTREESGWALPAGLSLGATVLLRPESPLLAAVVLLAIAASSANWTVRFTVSLPVALVTSLWYGVALWQNARGGDTVSLTAPVFGSLVAVFGAVAVVMAGGFATMKRLIGYADRAALVGLVSLILYFGQDSPEIAIDSAVSTFRNLTYNGLWLLTWVAALGLLVVALLVHRVLDSRLWTTPILGFGLLFCLLPLLREGAYRVGEGDSGNRMLAHFLAIVVAFLVLAAVDDRSAPWRRSHLMIGPVGG
jgi:hypothetical protein